MLLNFIVIVQEPWKASVSEVNQITPRDGTEPRALDVNGGHGVRVRRSPSADIPSLVKSHWGIGSQSSL